MTKKYRAERRNLARAAKTRFPWNPANAPTVEHPPVQPNKRDRSEAAEERRNAHITMDFTDGVAGISRALIQHKIGTVFKKKPKRGWAAKFRAAPFRNFLDDDKLHQARMRHPWYRKKLKWDKLRALLAAE